MSALTEQRTLHFDLSCFSPDREFTLLAGGGRKVLLKRYADRAADVSGLGDHVMAGHSCASARWAKQRGQHSHHRRLPGAVGPQEGVDLLIVYLEVHPRNRDHAAWKGAFQPPSLDRGHAPR